MMHVRTGREAAFELLVDRHQDALHAFLLRLSGSRDDALEVAQEALLTLWRKADRFDHTRGKLRTWLFQLARNALIDRQRRQQPGTVQTDPSENAAVSEIAAASEMAHREGRATSDRDPLDTLKALLGALPERQREALALCYLQGFSQRDCAAIMGISVTALESLLARGRATLKQGLGER